MTIEKFKKTYQQMTLENIENIRELYDNNLRFIDPFHQVDGLNNLIKYFDRLYKNLHSTEFVFTQEIITEKDAYLAWNMKLIHPKLKNGNEVLIEGMSYLQFSNEKKIIFHRDYFDGGAMLYENIPLIGAIIRWVKGQL